MLKATIGLLIAALLLTGCAATAEQPASNTQPKTTPTAATQAPQSPTSATQAPETLTEEEAKAIALADAKLTAEQVTWLRAELDRDDGRWEWEVDFRYDGFEYDYTIDAETGKILEFDKDRD